MAVTREGWLEGLRALMPTGQAWSRDPSSGITTLLDGLAAVFLAAQLRLEALLQEWEPLRSVAMLTDWERLLGLPDACTPAGQQPRDRQLAAYARLTELGGQSRPYFIDLASRLGEPGCTITEFRAVTVNSNCNSSINSLADSFVWRVNIPRPSLEPRWANCQSDCNASLQMYKPSAIECVFTHRKPAHTTVQFAYTA